VVTTPGAEAIARAAEASSLVVAPLPRWLVDDATPEALAGLLATYGRIAGTRTDSFPTSASPTAPPAVPALPTPCC
jgi:hypothetical protein